MKWIDLWRLAVSNMKRKRMRTRLTLIGVMIGTACIILMMAIGISNYNQFQAILEENPSLMQIEVYAPSTNDAIRGTLTDSALEAIRELPEVTAVSPVIQVFAVIYTGDYKANVLLQGVNSEVLELNYECGGASFGQENMPKLIISGEAKKQFETANAPLSAMNYEQRLAYEPNIDWLNADYIFVLGYEGVDELHSGAYYAKVTGVTQTVKNEYAGENWVYMDLQALKQILIENKEFCTMNGISLSDYTQALVRVETIDQMESVLKELQKRGYQTHVQFEDVLQMQREQNYQQKQLLIIGCIILFASAIGIANTMYVSVLERQGEIGIMKISGMKNKYIKRLFLMESLLIGGFGGFLGMMISYIVGMIFNAGAENVLLGMQLLPGQIFSIPLWLAVSTIVLIAGIGAMAGLYPAHRAAKMPPMEALRKGE